MKLVPYLIAAAFILALFAMCFGSYYMRTERDEEWQREYKPEDKP